MNCNSLLKFLYFEGYTDSYAEAEILIESLSDDEFDELCEKYVRELDTTGRGSDHHHGANVYVVRKVNEENRRDRYLRQEGESTKTAAMRKSRERRWHFSDGDTHKNTERENITWVRPGTRPYADSLDRQRKGAHRSERGIKKPRAGSSSGQRKTDAVWYNRFPEDRPRGKYQKLQDRRRKGLPTDIAAQIKGLLRTGERRRGLRTQAVNAIHRAMGGGYVTEELVNYLLVNSYVNDRHSALNLLESMSDAWFEEILESPQLSKSGWTPEDRETWKRLTQKYGPKPFTAMLQEPEPKPKTTTKSAKRKPTTNLNNIYIGQ